MMTALLKKEKKFLWMTNFEEIFQNLKQLFTTTHMLWIMDLSGDFIVCTYASKEGLGGVHMQNDYTIGYKSRKLKEHEQNYPT